MYACTHAHKMNLKFIYLVNNLYGYKYLSLNNKYSVHVSKSVKIDNVLFSFPYISQTKVPI